MLTQKMYKELFSFFILIIISSCVTQGEIETGVYKLEGKSPTEPNRNYEGFVVIEKYGPNYQLKWIIGDRQLQIGVGILENGVLSVGYVDGSGLDLGVVAFRVVNRTTLRGKWSPLGANTYGEEHLKFLAPSMEEVPQSQNPRSHPSSDTEPDIGPRI